MCHNNYLNCVYNLSRVDGGLCRQWKCQRKKKKLIENEEKVSFLAAFPPFYLIQFCFFLFSEVSETSPRFDSEAPAGQEGGIQRRGKLFLPVLISSYFCYGSCAAQKKNFFLSSN
jgi:hypothetical protein